MLWIIYIIWLVFAFVCGYFSEYYDLEFCGFLFLISIPLMFYVPFIIGL